MEAALSMTDTLFQQLATKRPRHSLGSPMKLVFSLCALLASFSATGTRSWAQTAESLSKVRKLYVDSLGSNDAAAEIRDRMIHRLGSSHDIQVAADRKEADAIVKGTSQIWVFGYTSSSTRSHTLRQPAYEGFLSVEVVGRNDETLWSYLVTPSDFPWSSITDDLAHQVVNKLVAAIKDEGRLEPAPSGTPAKAEGAVKGAGATFPAPLYQLWFELFQRNHPDVRIGYDAVGSEEGIRLLKEGKVDFCASEVPLSGETIAESHQRFTQLPTILGAVVPIYNLKGLRQPLRFTPETLAGIYLAKIRKWNDPQITASNRSAGLPDADIVVVHRSDGSGTSFVWTDYLSKISREWKASVGAGATVQWPVGIGAEHNEGVASTVQQTANSIGYVEFIYAIQHELNFGVVRNAAGRFIKADISSVTDAAAGTSDNPDQGLGVSITNPPGETAYPIATYTWLWLPERIEDKNKKALLLALLRWVLTSGQRRCSSLGYAPLPSEVAKRALQTLDATE
jgi:phosphate transport system substrate-binding protein